MNSGTNGWIEWNKLTTLSQLVKISSFAYDWTRVGFSLVAMNAGMKYVTEISVSPVTSWLESTIEWNSTDCVLDNDLAGVWEDRLLNCEWSNHSFWHRFWNLINQYLIIHVLIVLDNSRFGLLISVIIIEYWIIQSFWHFSGWKRLLDWLLLNGQLN